MVVADESSIWYPIFVSENIVTFLINAFTLIAFARSRRLRKRSTYLIINLTVADLLVGAVSGPLGVYRRSEIEPQQGFSSKKIIILTFNDLFYVSSLVNLSLISLERLHATLYPFGHCLIRKGTYYKIIVCSWLISLLLAAVDAFLFLYEPLVILDLFRYVWASYIVITLLVLTFSYVIIIAKVKSNPSPQNSGSVVSDRKLTVTLFIVTVVSILTILPWAFCYNIPRDKWGQLSQATRDHIKETGSALYYANSILNPLVYAVRMQEFRKASKELICKRTPESKRVQFIELHPM